MGLMTISGRIATDEKIHGAEERHLFGASMATPPDRHDDDRGPGIAVITRPKATTKKLSKSRLSAHIA